MSSTNREVIDAHAHYISPSSLSFVANSGQPGVSIEEHERGTIVNIDGNVYGPLPRTLASAEQQLAAMDQMGITHSVVSPPPFLFCYDADPGFTEEFARAQNEGLAELVRAHPDHFTGLATVPLQDPARANRVLTHAVEDLGLAGVEIGTHVAEMDLDHPSLAPFWQRVVELGVMIFIHPSEVRGVAFDAPYYLRNLIGNLLETSYCLSSMIYGGVFHRFPSLRVLASHAGGFLPYTIGRLDHGYRYRKECRSAIPEPPSTYFHQIYFDTIAHSAPALRYLVNLVGADHVALGSDYPFDMGDPHPLIQLDAIDDKHERRQIAAETGRDLITRRTKTEPEERKG